MRWSKLNRLNEITIPQKKVSVKYIKQLETQKLTLKQIKNYIITNLNLVKGDYRQEMIKEQWINYNNDISHYITEFETEVSSGFYIRQLIEDYATKTGLIGLGMSINLLFELLLKFYDFLINILNYTKNQKCQKNYHNLRIKEYGAIGFSCVILFLTPPQKIFFGIFRKSDFFL